MRPRSQATPNEARRVGGSNGLFAKARASDMDLAEIGEQLATRKAQLESQSGLLKSAKKLEDAGKGLVTRVLTEV